MGFAYSEPLPPAHVYARPLLTFYRASLCLTAATASKCYPDVFVREKYSIIHYFYRRHVLC